MAIRTAHKSIIFIAAAAILTLAPAGCNDRAKTTGDLSKNNSKSLDASAPAAHNPGEEPPLYFGEDWDKPGAQNPQAQNAQAQKGRAPSGAAGAKNAASGNSAADPDSTWALVLNTFTSEGHAQAAAEMLANLRTVAPQVDRAWVHTTPKGSMVVFGRYAGREDPQAKIDQAKLKQITRDGKTVFNRVILTRLDLRWARGTFDPFDLLSARKAHPNVDPLYTLDVAIWMANPDAKSSRERIPYEDARRQAEAYARELRAKNYEAYFYHDDQNQWSVVTVGLFDRRAVDARSGMYSAEVEAIIRRFPQRLANGEPLMEFKDRYNPKLGTKPQVPRLVVVPSM